MEAPFDKVDGVIATTSGYTGGRKEDPKYLEVSGGGTGHAESVQARLHARRRRRAPISLQRGRAPAALRTRALRDPHLRASAMLPRAARPVLTLEHCASRGAGNV